MTALVAAAVLVAAIGPGHADATAVTVKGDRLVVMTIGEFFANPQWPAAVEARVAALNRAGGIEDAAGATHQVKVIVCDTKADPSEAQRCAQRAVDQRVVAVVGMSTLDSDVIWPVLEAAGIPVIGSRVNTDRDATSPVAFPLAAGIVGMFSAMPQLLVRQGAHKVAVIVSDFGDATDSALALIRSGLSLTSAAAGPVVRVPLEATDLAPYAAAADEKGSTAWSRSSRATGKLPSQGAPRACATRERSSRKRRCRSPGARRSTKEPSASASSLR